MGTVLSVSSRWDGRVHRSASRDSVSDGLGDEALCDRASYHGCARSEYPPSRPDMEVGHHSALAMYGLAPLESPELIQAATVCLVYAVSSDRIRGLNYLKGGMS